MRVLAVISACLALLLAASPALADTCNKPASCPTSPAQVPLPYYSLTFDTPSTSAVTWGYNATDPDGCGHTGIAVTGRGGGISDGSATGYINLVNTTSAQAASSTALPSIGTSTVGGNLVNGSLGWTFEVTVKFLAQTQWAKIFCMGNGAGQGDLILGWQNQNLEIDFSEYTPTGANNPRTGVNEANVVVIPNPTVVLGQWYHIVVVVQQVDTFNITANYFSYVNSNLSAGTAATQYAIFDSARPLSYVGRSCYNSDTLMQMELDSFRIYNQALNAAQVNALYAQQMGGCNITMTANPTITSSFPNTVSQVTTPPTPIYSLNFSTDPTTAVGTGVTPSYAYEAFDQGDVACGLSSIHQGLAVLSGGPNSGDAFADPSFINLTVTSGPNAVANNPGLPQLGGLSTNTAAVAAGTAGLSFEMTFKPALQETWAKFFDIGSSRGTNTGTCNNDLVFGWVASSQVFMNFEVCDNTGYGVSMGEWGPFLAGYWYHVVISIQQLQNGQSNWYAYMNGQLINVQSNVLYPANAVRSMSSLGKSNWGDQTWSGWIDSFNIYNVALSPAQAANLSAVALGSAGSAACAFVPNNASTIPASALYYDLSFPTNPNVAGQAYNWLAFDPTDSPANQLIHRGLVNLSGSVAGNSNGTYINMAATSGPYSAGKVLGDVGGIGTGSINDQTVGWSFELSFKSYAQQTWAKVLDLGDGAGSGQWELFFGWHNTDPFYNMGVIFNDQQDYSGSNAAEDDLTPATPTITPGQWYHVVIVIAYDYLRSENPLPSGTVTYENGGIDLASFTVYTNGVVTGNSTSNLYLYKVMRRNSMLAKSNYGDSFWQGLIDTFRVYSIALNRNQVQTLYTASQQPPIANTTASSSSSSTGVAGNSTGSSSTGSSTGVTGIVPPIGGNSTSSSSSGARSSSSVGSSSTGSGTAVSSSTSATQRSSSSSSSSTAAPTVAPSTTSSATSAPNFVTSSPIVAPTTTPSAPTTTPSISSSSSSYTPPPITANGAAQSHTSFIALVIVAFTALMALAL